MTWHQGIANEINKEIPTTPTRMDKVRNTEGEMTVRMCNRNIQSLPVEMQNGTATLDDSLAVSYQTKHTVNIQLTNHTPWYSPKEVENLCPHKNPYSDVYDSFIHNCLNLEVLTGPSVGEWINKLWTSDNGILFGIKQKWAIKPGWNMGEF